MRPDDLAAWKAKRARIVRAAKAEPDLLICHLAERFGETPSSIGHALHAAGIRREPDYFSESLSGKRKLG